MWASLACRGRDCSRAGPAFGASEFEPVSVPMKAEQVAPHSWYVRARPASSSSANEGFNSNAGFVVTARRRRRLRCARHAGARQAPRRADRRDDAAADPPRRRQPLPRRPLLRPAGAEGRRASRSGPTRPCATTSRPRRRAARLAERRESLAPWVNEKTRIVAPDRYVGDDTTFRLGGLTFRVLHAGPAHTPEDLMMLVEEDGVLFVGDLMFSGRIPFVGDADVSAWIAAIDRVLALQAARRRRRPRPGVDATRWPTSR